MTIRIYERGFIVARIENEAICEWVIERLKPLDREALMRGINPDLKVETLRELLEACKAVYVGGKTPEESLEVTRKYFPYKTDDVYTHSFYSAIEKILFNLTGLFQTTSHVELLNFSCCIDASFETLVALAC